MHFVTGVKSIFSEEELEFMRSSIGLDWSDTKDYTDDELDAIYLTITEELPHDFDIDGTPLETGWLFERIIDKFLKHFDN